MWRRIFRVCEKKIVVLEFRAKIGGTLPAWCFRTMSAKIVPKKKREFDWYFNKTAYSPILHGTSYAKSKASNFFPLVFFLLCMEWDWIKSSYKTRNNFWILAELAVSLHSMHNNHIENGMAKKNWKSTKLQPFFGFKITLPLKTLSYKPICITDRLLSLHVDIFYGCKDCKYCLLLCFQYIQMWTLNIASKFLSFSPFPHNLFSYCNSALFVAICAAVSYGFRFICREMGFVHCHGLLSSVLGISADWTD